jgi:hypothetical protein
MPTTLSIKGRAIDPNRGGVLPQGTTANDVLAAFQDTYGVQQYDRQKSSRWPYYSYVSYPAAGSNVFNFFSQNQGQATNGQLDTNIEEAGNLGNYSYFIEGISFDIRVLSPATAPQPNTYTTDATAVYSDIVHGLAQAGYWQLKVGTNTWDMCPRPFLYSPPADGEIRMETNGAFSFTQSGMSPFAVTAAQSNMAYASLERRAWRRRLLKNPLFLAPQQNFSAQLRYDSGAIPLIATTVITGGATLYVGVWLDGTRFAPIG